MIYKDTRIKLSVPQRQIMDCKNRFIAVPTGRRFGKTFLIRCLIHRGLRNNPNGCYAYIAPTRTQAKQLLFDALVNDVRIYDKVAIINKSDLIITLSNGANIRISSGEAYDRLRGFGFNGVFFDETADISYECWSEVIRAAISDKQGFAYWFGTPKGKASWFYDLTLQSFVETFQFTTLDGGRVPLEEIEFAKSQLDERTYRQEYEGSFEAYSNLAYYAFSDENLTGIKYSPDANSFLCFDFNAGECPMSVGLVQEIDGKLVLTKEFVYKNTNTFDICEIVQEFLINNDFSGNLEITGDWSGRKRTSSSSQSDYEIIEHYFKNYRGYKVEKRPTLAIKDRVNSLNALFRAYDGTVNFWVNKECKHAINDFRRVEYLENGTQLNGKDKNLTHISDAISYYAYNYHSITNKLKIESAY